MRLADVGEKYGNLKKVVELAAEADGVEKLYPPQADACPWPHWPG